MGDIFYVVKFPNGNNEVVPDFWYSNEFGDCFWPSSNPQLSAEYRSNVKQCWPKDKAQILSVHMNYTEAAQRREKLESVVSDSVSLHLKQHSTRRSRKIPTRTSVEIDEPVVNSAKNRKSTTPTKETFAEKEDTLADLPPPPSKLLKRSVNKKTTTPCASTVFPSKTKTVNSLLYKRTDTPQLQQSQTANAFEDTGDEAQDIIVIPSSTVSPPSQEKDQRRHQQDLSVEPGCSRFVKNVNPTNAAVGNKKKTLAAPIVHQQFERDVLGHLKNIRRYVRSQARNVEDIKSEQRKQRNILRALQEDIRKLSLRPNSRSSSCPGDDSEEHQNPVFDNFFAPLNTMEEFDEFEKQLQNPEIKMKMIVRLRAYGGTDLGPILRGAWKQSMTDELMIQFTWKGQPKVTSNKQAGLSLEKSKLKLVIYEAVRQNAFSETDFKIFDSISTKWVQKASDRIRDKKKKIEKLNKQKNLEDDLSNSE